MNRDNTRTPQARLSRAQRRGRKLADKRQMRHSSRTPRGGWR